MDREALTIRQAATLLNCHPNTVRNRIKSGTYRAEKVVTEHGETYLIPRAELSEENSTNSLVFPFPSQSPSQPLPDVREAMRAMLEPFVRELGDVREELGRERERRERAEAELAKLREARESAVSHGPAENPRPGPWRGSGGHREPGGGRGAPAPWWRRVFGG